MEENGVDRDNMERASDYLVVNSNNTELESGGHVFQHLTCLESKNATFGQNASQRVLPTKDDASPPPNAQIQLCQPPPFPVEDFQLVDQNCHSLYEVQSLEASSTHMMIVASHSENGQVLHVVPSTQPGIAQVIIPQGQLLDVSSSGDALQETNCDGNMETVAVAAIADNTSSYIFHPEASLTVSKKTTTRVLEDPFPVSPQPLPPNTPAWARRLRSCEKIGDSYRGYCSSEMELDSILILHKQQTQSVWGTRQSPSPAKPATRLMWKSQYVPYDGIPFLNAGSRAIVMECQYGPRRKGFQTRKSSEQDNVSCQLYKATCPARIYIKKVQKFPEYRVPTDPKIDKKIIRMEQEKAFNMLKKNLIEVGGVFRWYVQLPTQQAHQYHEMEEMCLPPSLFSVPSPEEDDDTIRDENCVLPSRLHPQVADKIRELVSQGIQQVYAVRKQLRRFVEQELFKPDEVPERHNLSFFPTVNDIKNHIHEVQKTLKNGKVVYSSESVPAMLQWTADGGNLLSETVTVTFASPPTKGSSLEKTMIKVESNQTREFLGPEMTQFLSSLQPRVFAQLKGLQLQPTLTSAEGTATLITLDSCPPPNSSRLLHPTGKLTTSKSLIDHSHTLQDSSSQTQNDTAVSQLGEQPLPDQRDSLVTAGRREDAKAIQPEVHQVLLGDVCTVPTHTVENHPALSKNPESVVSTGHVEHETKEEAISSEAKRTVDHHGEEQLLRDRWTTGSNPGVEGLCTQEFPFLEQISESSCPLEARAKGYGNALEAGGNRYKRTTHVHQHHGAKTLQKLTWQLRLKMRVCKFFWHGLKRFSGFHLINQEYVAGMEENRRHYNVAFDFHEFSVSKDHFPFKAIQIAKKPPAWRTEAEIRYLRNLLLTLESFSAYSPTLQNLLAKVIRFEQFERRRVIIKKGQHGSSFYFVFAGMVAVTDDEDGSSAFIDTAPTVLRKGASFGEVALIKDSKRIATVVCMEETELLVVDKKDFFAYKLDHELHRELVTRYNYLRKVEIFETLSNASIEKIANFCRIERFHFGQVITSDIGGSSSITFIIKGACDVLRQIDLSSCPSYHKWLSKQLLFLKSKPQVKEKKHLDYCSAIAYVDRFKSAKWNSFSGHELSQLKARYACQPLKRDFGKESSVFSRPHKSVVIKVETAEEDCSPLFEQLDDDREVVQKVISGVVEKKSVYSTPYGDIPASAAAAVYIRVDELYKGDYLVNLQDNRPMILVSKGADIIHLKKDKLEECADDATIMKLCKIKVKYPSDDELCQVFLRQNSWEFFKKDLLQLVMKPKLMRMATPPDLCPAEEIAGSWYMNEKGILDLTPLQSRQSLPPETCKYVPCHPKCTKEVEFLPEIQPRLIHGINESCSWKNSSFR